MTSKSIDEKIRAYLNPALLTFVGFFVLQIYLKVEDIEKTQQLMLIKDAAYTQRIEVIEKDVADLKQRMREQERNTLSKK